MYFVLIFLNLIWKRLLYVYAISSFSRFQWSSTTWFFSKSDISVFVLQTFHFHNTENSQVFPRAKPISVIARVILPWRWSWTLMAGCMILSLQNPFFHTKWLDYAKLDLKDSLNLFRMGINFVVCPKGELNLLFMILLSVLSVYLCSSLFPIRLKTGTLVWAHLYHFKPTKL